MNNLFITSLILISVFSFACGSTNKIGEAEKSNLNQSDSSVNNQNQPLTKEEIKDIVENAIKKISFNTPVQEEKKEINETSEIEKIESKFKQEYNALIESRIKEEELNSIKNKTLNLIAKYEKKLKNMNAASKLLNEIKLIKKFTQSYYKYLNMLKAYDLKFKSESYDRFTNNIRYFGDHKYSKKKFDKFTKELENIKKELKKLKKSNESIITKKMKLVFYEDNTILNKQLHIFNLFINSNILSGKSLWGKKDGLDFRLWMLENSYNLFKAHNKHLNGYINTCCY